MTSTYRRKILSAVAAAAVTLAGAGAAFAQDNYPSKPIRVVVPYTPGGVSDTVTRLVMQKLAERLKGTIIVDNQAGANGQIGSSNVARSTPDGYTLLVVVAAHAINPSLYPKMTYSPLQDLRGVSEFGAIPLLMVSSAQLPPKNLKEFVAWAKANPQTANFASSGAGSGAHLVGELFSQTTGVPMQHVAYKGIAPALPDLFAGQVAMIFDSVQTMMPQVKAGKLHALAMTSAKRWPAAPDVPTMAEAGYPGMTGGSWIGLLAPAKTPKEIVAKLSAETQKVLDMPDVREKLIEYGIDPVGGTPEQFDAFIQSEAKRWADVVKKADIRLE
ncbi:tripartite tricarboxylate transporter substrate binding protein [Variovorax sp. Sphag1AA]|uniref:tripartite tricarboxylate transporter substrate binding protein n=1 Tax=Variovorax sp. Sphag1AA TaxID=2587027 RepID=UPI0016162786|nr:tripartite tricarboxylate transporter substrate binding protein [Variovorax sp. Sphag1AA]MBB3179310.1 tripartite-type tricarboxylate transporter receptor subunit TctC [Variovorax sp. Sphag1AA]MBO9648964.1 tripartite tricarboxylate transporter substrate binding protein [Variovorax sp.]